MDSTAISQQARPGARGAIFASVEECWEMMRPVLRGIVETFGRHCEVVLHDFRDPEHSIVAIEGDITHRHVGGSVTQIGLSLIAQGDDAEDEINYITRTASGRIVKSSTILLRDRSDHVFGALCINFDITDLRLLASAVEELTGSPAVTPEPIAFVDDIGQVIRAVIDEEEVALGHSIDRMTKRDRLAIFRALDRRGIFALQRSVPTVAEYLGISRATAYNYLHGIRSGATLSDEELDDALPDERNVR